MANTNAPFGFVPFEYDTGTEIQRKVFLGTGQLVAIGDPIYLASSSGAKRATSTQAIFGIAAEAVTATVAGTRLSLHVIPAKEGMELKAQFVGTTNMSDTYNGKSYQLSGNSGVMGVDPTKTTGGPLRFVGFLVDPKTGKLITGTYAIGRFVVQKSQYTGQA